MKTVVELIIKKRNPNFSFDKNITIYVIADLVVIKSIELIRGIFKLIFQIKKPDLIFIGKNVRFFNARKIDIGRWTKIDDGVRLSGLGKGKLSIGSGVSIGAYSQIIVSTTFNNLGEYITIGNNVGIGQFASLGGSGGLEIKKNCIIGQYFSCHPENHNYDNLGVLIKNQGTSRKSIVIEENCWIGAKVTILAGVTIGANSIIAAGAVVTRSFPKNSVIGGVPAKLLKVRE